MLVDRQAQVEDHEVDAVGNFIETSGLASENPVRITVAVVDRKNNPRLVSLPFNGVQWECDALLESFLIVVKQNVMNVIDSCVVHDSPSVGRIVR